MSIEGAISIRIETAAGRVTATELVSSRPVNASRMLEGQGMKKALDLLPVIFSVCGMAQATAGARACESALGQPASDALELRREQLVAVENLREHLWRLFMDWPVFAGNDGDRKALAEICDIQRKYSHALFPDKRLFCSIAAESEPPAQTALLHERLRDLLDRLVFGMPFNLWTEMTTFGELEAWMHDTHSVAARYLERIHELGWEGSGRNSIGALPVLDASVLHRKMEKDAFISEPRWEGECRETTPYTRTDSTLLRNLRAEHGNGLMPRLVARLSEIAQTADWLLSADGKIRQTAIKGDGIGQACAARGQLFHSVVLDEANRIEHYRILAPTEWNFHPQGVVSCSLKTLQGDRQQIEAQAHQLIRAIDPCVAYELTVGRPQGSGYA